MGGGGTRSGVICSRIGTRGASCEHGNNLSGYIKYGEYVDQLRNYQLLKTDSAHGVN